MQADFQVVLDACVLANAGLCDLFLRLAEPPRLYLPLWSQEILDEVHPAPRPPSSSGRIHRNLRTTGVSK